MNTLILKWNGPEKRNPPNVEHVAGHLRIDYLEAQRLIDGVQDRTITKEDFKDYVNQQRERWAKEAFEAIALLQSGGA